MDEQNDTRVRATGKTETPRPSRSSSNSKAHFLDLGLNPTDATTAPDFGEGVTDMCKIHPWLRK